MYGHFCAQGRLNGPSALQGQWNEAKVWMIYTAYQISLNRALDYIILKLLYEAYTSLSNIDEWCFTATFVHMVG